MNLSVCGIYVLDLLTCGKNIYI